MLHTLGVGCASWEVVAQLPHERTRALSGGHSVDGVSMTQGSVLLDAGGVGLLLGVGRSSVYAMNAREALPSPIRVGRGKRWARAEIEAWVLHGAPNRSAWARMWPKVRNEVMRR